MNVINRDFEVWKSRINSSVCDKQNVEQYRKFKKHDPRTLRSTVCLLMMSTKWYLVQIMLMNKKLTHYHRTLQSMKSLSMLQNIKTNV